MGSNYGRKVRELPGSVVKKTKSFFMLCENILGKLKWLSPELPWSPTAFLSFHGANPERDLDSRELKFKKAVEKHGEDL
ncbi:hypothetical protein C1H46_012046 [Malus baccata]|uniref:Uncharacterized protein n=1 Tax=Malus baccata TaxID=106549 RepID=A0A540MTZ6_MALBA|nr:hypothetical protein C1H46_012045 [Malus baccata]TQE02277.1 hypothetical protein C1H46_012046 [Malus baccata]